jgi:SAM-dependent methyltransferase
VITTWSQGLADENMPEQMLVETLAQVRKHPWWHARARLAVRVLEKFGIRAPATVLDVGCGWGVTLDALIKHGYSVTGLDISRRILELIDRPELSLVEADLTNPSTAFSKKFDAVLVLDVLEHLDDDRDAVARIAQLLRPGGIMIASVPALPELFSEFDQIQGHRRRYVPQVLQKAFENTGLDIRQIFWWGSWMVPVLTRSRLREQSQAPRKPKTYSQYLQLPPWPAPLLMRFLYAREAGKAIQGTLTTGTSLFAVAEKRG